MLHQCTCHTVRKITKRLRKTIGDVEEIIIVQIDEIKIIDCIQILKIKDYNNEIKDIIPAWQTLSATFGSSMTTEQILNSVHQIG